MTEWHEHKPEWMKLYRGWWDSLSHSQVSALSLWIGVLCLYQANRNGRRADGSGVVAGGNGQPLTANQIARINKLRVRDVRTAVRQLTEAGTFAVGRSLVEAWSKSGRSLVEVWFEEGSASGCELIIPNLRKWQESPDSYRKRRQRARRDSPGIVPGEDRREKIEDRRRRRRGDGVEPKPPKTHKPPGDADAPARQTLSLALVEPESKAVAVFQCVGHGPKSWALTDRRLKELEESYPDLDVMAEVLKAREWIRANPTRRKTHKGIERFLVSWLNRATDSGRSGPSRYQTDAERGHQDAMETAEEEECEP